MAGTRRTASHLGQVQGQAVSARFAPADAQELARIFGLSAMSAGSELEVRVVNYLETRYREVYIEGQEQGALDRIRGQFLEPPYKGYAV